MVSRLLRSIKRFIFGPSAKLDKNMRDYSQEEFFLKKAEAAKELFAKYGYPKELSSK